MGLVLILKLQALATVVLAFPDNEANDDEILPQKGDLSDFVLHEEADAHEANVEREQIDALRHEDANLEEGWRNTEREDKMMQDSERLEIEAKNAQKANLKRKLVQIATGYKKHIWELNDELHACSKSHEKISEQLRYSRSKLATVHGLIDQETSKASAITSQYGGLAQDLRKSYESDNRRIEALTKDVNQSNVMLLSAKDKLSAEESLAMNMSAMVNATAYELLSTLTSSKKKKVKLSELENASLELNSSMLVVNSNYRKWSHSLDEEQRHFKSKTGAAANQSAAEAAEVKHLLQEAASLGSELTAAETKRKNMQAQVEKAEQLLAKDAELISRFEIKFEHFATEAAESCKQQKTKLQGDLDHTADDLESKLERARSGQQELQNENQQLKDEIKDLRMKIAAADARAKEAKASVKKEAKVQAKAQEAKAQAWVAAQDAKAQAEAAEEKARVAAEEAHKKEAESQKAKAEAQKAAEEARGKEAAKQKAKQATDDQDSAVDEELEAPESSDEPSPKQEAAQAQEEVDRAWTAEQHRKNEAEAKAAQLSKKATPQSVSAHASADNLPEQNDHRKRSDDVDREVAEELNRRHSDRVSQEFSKMTVKTMEASKGKQANKISSWNEFVHGKANGAAAHPNAKLNKFLDLSEEY